MSRAREILGMPRRYAHSCGVLEKVTEMTGANWREKAEELEEMLRGMVPNG